MVAALHFVHRRIGRGKQHGPVVTDGARVGHTDACRAADHGGVADVEWRSERRFEPLDEPVGAWIGGLVDNRELVAAEAGNDIGAAHDGQQPVGGLTQHLVAGIVAI